MGYVHGHRLSTGERSSGCQNRYWLQWVFQSRRRVALQIQLGGNDIGGVCPDLIAVVYVTLTGYNYYMYYMYVCFTHPQLSRVWIYIGVL